MIRAAIENENKALNQFPTKNGAFNHMSPFRVMTGRPSPNYNDMKIEFGAYAQVFEANDPTNTTKARTTRAIALTPTGNAQGGYNFLSLSTGRKLARQQWDELPLPDGVIERVEGMAEDQKQPDNWQGAPLFEWAPGIPMEDEDAPIILSMSDGVNAIEEEDENDNETDTESEEDNLDGYTDNGEETEESEDAVDELRSEHESSDETPEESEEEPRSEHESSDEESAESEWNSGSKDDSTLRGADGDGTLEGDVDEIPPTTTGAVQTRHNMRPNRTRDYSKRFDHVMDNPASTKSYDTQSLQHERQRNAPTLRNTVEEMQQTGSDSNVMKYMTGIILTQMTVKAGIKKHGQLAIDALFKEFSQLHGLNVFSPQDSNKLSKDEKRGALRAISVIKEKRCGRIKGRTVADGRPQQPLYTKEETSLPTVSTDALLMSVVIDALERRDVATADVTGAYLHANMDDFTLLKLEGEAVYIMCDVSGEYTNFVQEEQGKKVLYLKLLKSLYGCVKSALLWYELFSTTLVQMGFTINPYDTCVTNKVINGKQCTIVWYVDDTKISHVEHQMVTKVIADIEASFGKITVSRGKGHVFWGMDINFREDGTASIKMKEYIKEAIEAFGDKIVRTAATLAKKNLFDIDEDSKDLSTKEQEVLHSVVAKLSYVSKRGRLDIQLAVAFLCTRVSKSTNRDWTKLLEYLDGTLEEYVVLGADDIGAMKTWVDESYAVHHDMKSHTGVVSFGQGAVMSKSSKQKLNTKSSTEAKLVGASDYLPYPIWMKKFLTAQGYPLHGNVFYQDNQSTIRFEKNGRK